MDNSRHSEIDTRVAEQFDQLKREEAHNRMLRDPTIGGNAPRPSQSLIETSIGKMPRTERQLKQQARDNVAKELRAERKLQQKQRSLQKSVNRQQPTNQNAPQNTGDPKEQQRQALRNKLKRDHHQARSRSR